MNVNWRDYISSDCTILKGKPCFIGTRIPVSLILGYLAEGMSAEEILRDFPALKQEQIVASFAYARDLSEFEVAV